MLIFSRMITRVENWLKKHRFRDLLLISVDVVNTHKILTYRVEQKSLGPLCLTRERQCQMAFALLST